MSDNTAMLIASAILTTLWVLLTNTKPLLAQTPDAMRATGHACIGAAIAFDVVLLFKNFA